MTDIDVPTRCADCRRRWAVTITSFSWASATGALPLACVAPDAAGAADAAGASGAAAAAEAAIGAAVAAGCCCACSAGAAASSADAPREALNIVYFIRLSPNRSVVVRVVRRGAAYRVDGAAARQCVSGALQQACQWALGHAPQRMGAESSGRTTQRARMRSSRFAGIPAAPSRIARRAAFAASRWKSSAPRAARWPHRPTGPHWHGACCRRRPCTRPRGSS
ncbi:hypothetical protein DID99_26565 [Burkholderia sp. Bp8986]|nr:hypothetical protein DID99_26565 [Burkholderia sp. Bp8986]